MSVAFKLDAFEGPLDLLLQLIARAKVDIADIFVSEITEQFIEAVRQMQQMDMDVASDFINMAATLLRIKSRALLPGSEKDAGEFEDERALRQQLEDYRRIRAVLDEFGAMERSASAHYYKLREEFAFERDPLDLTGIDLQSLFLAMQELIAQRNAREGVEEKFNVVRRDPISVRSRIEMIQRTLARLGRVAFSRLFDADVGKDEIIATFLALLEVISAGMARVEQSEQFAEIEIVATGG
jgi:segregation and condensation protein A